MTDSELNFKLLASCFRRSKRKGLVWMDQVLYRVMYQGGHSSNSLKLVYLFYLLFILYLTTFSLSVVIDCAANNYNQFSYWAQPRVISLTSYRDLPFLSSVFIKLAYLILMSFAYKQFIFYGLHIKYCKKYRLKSFTPANIFFGQRTTRARQIGSCLLIAVSTINFLLIAIVNPSMLNPGPSGSNLSVYYQNVQGLIPFSNLGDSHPILNRTKVLELNTYINTNNPDLVMLTETWLKKSIRDHEVIENTNYNVFRNDRSQSSHPSDPSNPKKFRKFGGGVLIAIRSDIEVTSKRISLCRGAEIVAIEVTINESKFIFCNCYRVGTLGNANFMTV